MAKDFTYLDELIHSGADEIFLDDDIVLGPEEEEKYRNGIDIDMDFISIDGMGHKIDARAKSRIFNINDCDCYVIGITFENGFSNEDGGAIIMEGDYVMLTARECTFSNNSASNGAALLAYRNVILEKCLFKQNESDEAGSAIAVSRKTEINVISCEFHNNVSGYGGAIANAGRLEVKNSTFEKNTSKDCGAAISSIFSILPRSINDYGKSTGLAIEKSTFKCNSADYNGGAIYSNSHTEIIDCHFYCNSASLKGGALNVGEKTDLKGCTFRKNSASECGGAIHNSRDLKIIDCEFIANFSSKCGGAISNNDHIKVCESKFVSNSADNNGGTIVNFGFFYLANCTFNDNKSKIGGVLYNGKYVDITDSHFNGNGAWECGGVIFNKYNVKIDNSLFAKNHSKIALVIYNSYKLELFNSIFEKNFPLEKSEPIINEENTVFVRQNNMIEEYSKK